MISKNISNLISMIRIDHWFKNIFVLPGILFAILLTDESFNFQESLYYLRLLLSVCLIASSNYLINEYLDSKFDKYHPVKKNRPAVKNNFKLIHILITYFLLIILSFIISYDANFKFSMSLLLLLTMGVLYNVNPIRLKDKPYLDILSESLNNPIRLILGWYLVTDNFLPPSSLILSFWMGGAFLMTIKRFAEIRSVKKKYLNKYRASFKYYTENLLLLKSFFYSLMTTFFLGIFLIKYRIEYLITFPFLSLLFVYYLSIGLGKNSITQTPEKLYRNKYLNLIVILNVIVFLISTFFDFNKLAIFTKSINFD